jgi:hypothetical protein
MLMAHVCNGGMRDMCGVTRVVRNLLVLEQTISTKKEILVGQIGCMLQMCAGCTLAAFRGSRQRCWYRPPDWTADGVQSSLV